MKPRFGIFEQLAVFLIPSNKASQRLLSLFRRRYDEKLSKFFASELSVAAGEPYDQILPVNKFPTRLFCPILALSDPFHDELYQRFFGRLGEGSREQQNGGNGAVCVQSHIHERSYSSIRNWEPQVQPTLN